MSRHSPLTLLFAISGVLLASSLFLFSTHAYFLSLERQLEEKAAMHQAKRIIDEQISSKLFKLKSFFYELIPEERERRRQTTHQLIERELASIRSALDILDKGGVYLKSVSFHPDDHGELFDPISYTPPSNETYRLELLELHPLLLQLQEKLTALEELLSRRDKRLSSGQGGNLFLVRKEIGRFLKESEPLFTTLTEKGNAIHYNSSARATAIRTEGDKLLRQNKVLEFSAIVFILASTLSLCFFVGRKIVVITNQLQREIEEKQAAQQKISRAKEEWERTFDAVPDAVALLDTNHRIMRLNRAMADLIGQPVQQCVGTFCYTLMHQTFAPPDYCPHCRLLSDHQEHTVIVQLGDNAFFEVSVSPLFDNRGELIGSVHIARDISEQKKAQHALKKANEELEQRVEDRTLELKKFISDLQSEITGRIKAEEALIQTQHQLLHAEKLSAIGKLSASLAHEFNNPLFAVTNILATINQQERLSQENDEMLRLAIHECDRMKKLIANLRDFKRPSSGKIVFTHVHTTIDNMLLLCKKEFSDRKIEVEKEFASNMPPVPMISDQICQVLLNLLTNARDACAGGGIVRIRTELREGAIAIEVADSGCGIDPAQLNQIFKPFYTTKAEMSGTGLGLAVSLGIVERHGGTLSVRSAVGKGSTFTLVLPRHSEMESIDGTRLLA